MSTRLDFFSILWGSQSKTYCIYGRAFYTEAILLLYAYMLMTWISSKQRLRDSLKLLHHSISVDEKRSRAAVLWNKVEAMQSFQSAKTVLLYWSLDDEVYTHDFIRKRYTQKIIALPCIHEDGLLLRRFTGVETMTIGQQFSLAEPAGEVITAVRIDLAFIPGVAFDGQGNRLGRGKGYYDRFLPQLHCPTIGICYDRQMVETIPVQEHDRGVNQIMTVSL